MDHISHHLNPGSWKTKRAADYSTLCTQQTVLGWPLPESTKSGGAAIEMPERHRKIAGHRGMVKQGDKTL